MTAMGDWSALSSDPLLELLLQSFAKRVNIELSDTKSEEKNMEVRYEGSDHYGGYRYI